MECYRTDIHISYKKYQCLYSEGTITSTAWGPNIKFI